MMMQCRMIPCHFPISLFPRFISIAAAECRVCEVETAGVCVRVCEYVLEGVNVGGI